MHVTHTSGISAEAGHDAMHLLNPDKVLCGVAVSSRKHALELLSGLLAAGSRELAPAEVYPQLNQRERLGSTCLGNGVALPHCRLPGLAQPLAALLLPAEPVDFDGGEEPPVRVVLGLLLPDGDDRGLVAALAQRLAEPATFRALIQARSPAEAAELVNGQLPPPRRMAANA